jgi:GTP-binding protein HflX
VGYTSAGKSTLFGALTGAEVAISDQLFMTLDPLVRKAALGNGREVLLVDTVGFIQKLPLALVAAFRATLEEVVEADLLLHVVDASAEDPEPREAAVEEVLREIGAAEVPRLTVLNKADLLEPARAAALVAARPDAFLVSARTGQGLRELRETVADRLALDRRRVHLRFRTDDTRGIAAVYSAGRVVAHEVQGDEARLEADLPERLIGRYRDHLV